jgi:hypothetical protein
LAIKPAAPLPDDPSLRHAAGRAYRHESAAGADIDHGFVAAPGDSVEHPVAQALLAASGIGGHRRPEHDRHDRTDPHDRARRRDERIAAIAIGRPSRRHACQSAADEAADHARCVDAVARAARPLLTAHRRT